ncbi:unnamed protein product [Anisakis simplex]|uniref:Uncharacterized protein n=1 Tax=Anisakis simplex TaxID=6269 RepID=A0A0M3K1W4_ANISI|nr:unnamed protein product [Anisakis simplex]
MSSRTSSSPASLHSHPTSTSVSVACCFPPATSVSSSSNIITTSSSNTNNPHSNQQQQKAASPVTQQQQQQQQFTIRTAAPFQQQSANTSYPTMSANDSSSSSSPAEAFSRLCLGGEIIQVPTAIVQQEWLFRAVVTKDAYRSLSVEAQTYLKRFLPKYDGATEKEDEEKILDSVFTNDPNFYFGNPLGKIYSKLRCGWFNPERPGDQVQLRDNRRVLYDHYIRYYHISLLKKLLISRRKLLEQFATLGGNEEPTCSAPDSALIRKRNTTTRLKARAEYRTRLMLDDVKRRVDDTTQSSDEECKCSN